MCEKNITIKQSLIIVWEKFIILLLFILIFYAGAMTGIFYGNNETIKFNKRVNKIEENVKDIGTKVTVLEAITKKLK